MARLHLSWLHYRFGRKRNRATDLGSRHDSGDESGYWESGYWALVDATMRDTGASDG